MRAELELEFASRAHVMEVLELLQEACEGHHQLLQDFLAGSGQSQEVTTIDLVTEVSHSLAAAYYLITTCSLLPTTCTCYLLLATY